MLQPLRLPRCVGPNEMNRLRERSTSLLPCSSDLGKVSQIGVEFLAVLARRVERSEDDQGSRRGVEKLLVIVWRKLVHQGVLVRHDKGVDLFRRGIAVVEIEYRGRLVGVVFKGGEDAPFRAVDLG